MPRRYESGHLKNYPRMALVVQWLRLHLPMQGTRLSPCSRKIPHASGQLSRCATTTGPGLCNRRKIPQGAVPCTAARDEAPLAASRESFHTAVKTQHSRESKTRSVGSDSLRCHGLYHGVLQARIPEWVAFPFSRGSSQPRDQTQVSCIAGGFFTS